MILRNNKSPVICSDKPQLSIVIPAFNEQENLRRLYEELLEILSKLNMSWEVIIADDGSNDNTWQVIKSIHNEDERVKGIRLSRNFGHQYALFAGLSKAAGEAVISMDADLQHPPEVIPRLVDEWRKGNNIVNTIREYPKNVPLLKRVSSKLFYKMFSLLSGVKLGEGMSDFRLLDRQALNSILTLREEGLFLRGIVQWIGYASSELTFVCNDRFEGRSKYTFKEMLKFASSGIISFSIIPLRLGVIIGLLTSLISFILFVEVIYEKVVLNITVPGWATSMSVMSFMFGILFILLGIVGEYIGRLLIEVKSRPRFLISEQIGIRKAANDSRTD